MLRVFGFPRALQACWVASPQRLHPPASGACCDTNASRTCPCSEFTVLQEPKPKVKPHGRHLHSWAAGARHHHQQQLLQARGGALTGAGAGDFEWCGPLLQAWPQILACTRSSQSFTSRAASTAPWRGPGSRTSARASSPVVLPAQSPQAQCMWPLPRSGRHGRVAEQRARAAVATPGPAVADRVVRWAPSCCPLPPGLHPGTAWRSQRGWFSLVAPFGGRAAQRPRRRAIAQPVCRSLLRPALVAGHECCTNGTAEPSLTSSAPALHP